MARRSIQMKALEKGVVNLEDGSILVLDPDHVSDNRARYPRVFSKNDADRLERDHLAERYKGEIPVLDTKEAREAEKRRTALAEQIERAREAEEEDETGDRHPSGRRGATKRAPGVETDAEAAAAADQIEGLDEAPARGRRGGR